MIFIKLVHRLLFSWARGIKKINVFVSVLEVNFFSLSVVSGDAHVQRLSTRRHSPSYICSGPIRLPKPFDNTTGPVHRAAGKERQWQDHKLPAFSPVPGVHRWQHWKDLYWYRSHTNLVAFLNGIVLMHQNFGKC